MSFLKTDGASNKLEAPGHMQTPLLSHIETLFACIQGFKS